MNKDEIKRVDMKAPSLYLPCRIPSALPGVSLVSVLLLFHSATHSRDWPYEPPVAFRVFRLNKFKTCDINTSCISIIVDETKISLH